MNLSLGKAQILSRLFEHEIKPYPYHKLMDDPLVIHPTAMSSYTEAVPQQAQKIPKLYRESTFNLGLQAP